MFAQVVFNLAALLGVACSSSGVHAHELRGGEGNQDSESGSTAERETFAFQAFQESKKGNDVKRGANAEGGIILLREGEEPDRYEGSESINGHACLRNMEFMTQSMFDLAAEYPRVVTIEDIGDSYLKTINYTAGDDMGLPDDVPLHEGGYDIYAMKITAPDGPCVSSEKGKMLVLSGVHSREYAPPELNMRFAEALVEGYNKVADVTWLLQHTEFHIIIYVNPDGRYIAERRPDLYWRKNVNTKSGGGCSTRTVNDWHKPGVDINRNYDFAWGDPSGASSDPCQDDFHGEAAMDQPETQAVVEYAKSLFPEEQQRDDPEADVYVPFGENITGLFVDIHAAGGHVYYPWGYDGERSADDDALQALGRKVAYWGGYKLWAPGSPDFEYMASGDSTDYMYGALGVATFGLEIGKQFYEDCNHFETQVIAENLPALLYGAKVAKKPFSLVKGPDILSLQVGDVDDEYVSVMLVVSDSLKLNKHHPGQTTGDQGIEKVLLYLDVHPDNYQKGDAGWEARYKDFNADPLRFAFNLPVGRLAPGRHTLFAQVMDTAGYDGPVSSAFFYAGEEKGMTMG